MIAAHAVDWTNVLLALIAALPGIIAAVYAGRVHHKIKTPSGTAIGKQVEGTRHTVIANNQQLVAAAARTAAVTPPQLKSDAP